MFYFRRADIESIELLCEQESEYEILSLTNGANKGLTNKGKPTRRNTKPSIAMNFQQAIVLVALVLGVVLSEMALAQSEVKTCVGWIRQRECNDCCRREGYGSGSILLKTDRCNCWKGMPGSYSAKTKEFVGF